MSYLWGKETLSFQKRGFKKWISLSLRNCNRLCTSKCLSLRNRDLQRLVWLVLLTEKAGGFHVPTWLQRAAGGTIVLHRGFVSGLVLCFLCPACSALYWTHWIICTDREQGPLISTMVPALTDGRVKTGRNGDYKFHWETTAEESANDAKIIMNLGCAG